MIQLRPFALLVVIGCGDPTPAPACTTTLSGNLTETVDSAAACATLDATGALAIAVTAPTSGTTLMISIDLGASPSPAMYSSETVMTWSALGERTTADGGGCVYAAGNDAVPTSSFTLVLAAAGDAPHGDLHLVQYVQAMPQTDCGPGDTELVDLTF